MYKTLVKLSLIIALLGLLSCQQTSPHKVLFVEGETQGTSYHISYTDTLQRNLKPQIDSILADFSKELSTYDSTSTISRFNRTKKGMRLRGYFATVLLESERINQLTHGAFDPTVMPLVNFWGFGTKKAAETIDTSQLAGILKLVGMDKLEIHKLPPTGVVVTKKHAGVALDFNAIAQGYTCDVLGNYLQKNGIKNFLIEVGGEMLAAGKSPVTLFGK
ncbi:MAG: FAD:protein FMN transferase [Chitinophagales bacterium]